MSHVVAALSAPQSLNQWLFREFYKELKENTAVLVRNCFKERPLISFQCEIERIHRT